MIFSQKEALRLSQKIDAKGNLSPEAFSSTLETMKSFAYMCKLYQADRIIAVATAAIRTAKNGSGTDRAGRKRNRHQPAYYQRYH
jgi:exopolyphosphatase/guanosine-5'-triphosphate,3'-diphosphate pyrophosphatase